MNPFKSYSPQVRATFITGAVAAVVLLAVVITNWSTVLQAGKGILAEISNCSATHPLACADRLLGAAGAGSVYTLPAPTADPIANLKMIQAAINNPLYSTIGASSVTQTYPIKGNLEIRRSLTLQNLSLAQQSTSTVIRTISAYGSGTPISVTLSNVKIQRGPANSEDSGSVSDSAGIWFDKANPTFKNVEVFGGGKGRGINIVNATSGTLSAVNVHDMTWQPYAIDRTNPSFWNTFRLSYVMSSKNWNIFQIHDFDGHQIGSTPVRIEEQLYGIVFQNSSNITMTSSTVARLQVRFADGQLYPYQTDGITVVSGDHITIRNANVSFVNEGFDIPGYPPTAITVKGSTVTDSPTFCYKIRGAYSYTPPSFTYTPQTNSPVFNNDTATRCGWAGFVGASGGDSWIINSIVKEIGIGPYNTTPIILNGVPYETIAAYEAVVGSTVPVVLGTRSLGMHVLSATVDNQVSHYMQYVFHSAVSGLNPATRNIASGYTVSNPSNPNIPVSNNFTVINSNVAKNPSLLASWADLHTLDAQTLACPVYLNNYFAWFLSGPDNKQTYGNISSYLTGLKNTHDYSPCIDKGAGSQAVSQDMQDEVVNKLGATEISTSDVSTTTTTTTPKTPKSQTSTASSTVKVKKDKSVASTAT